LAGHFAFTEAAVRSALRLGHAQAAVIGHGALARLTRAGAALGLPPWSPDMPRPAKSLPETRRKGAQALYFPACITRTFGPAPGDPSVAEILVGVAARAGVPVWIPPAIEGTCCGMPFSSKGYAAAHDRCANAAIERLWKWSEEGRLPVVVDTSPCAWTLKTCREDLTEANRKRFDALRILDSVQFARDSILPNLQVLRRAHAVALHPVCSLVKMGLEKALRDIAAACADEVFIAFEAGCCGFAGDRGFLHPELTEAATRAEAEEIRAQEFDGHYASSRTCEIGMTRATQRVWRSIWALLDDTTR